MSEARVCSICSGAGYFGNPADGVNCSTCKGSGQAATPIQEAVGWLMEAAKYFERKDDGGEDAAFWAGVYNAENCRKIAGLLAAFPSPASAARPAVDARGGWFAVFKGHTTGSIWFSTACDTEDEAKAQDDHLGENIGQCHTEALGKFVSSPSAQTDIGEAPKLTEEERKAIAEAKESADYTRWFVDTAHGAAKQSKISQDADSILALLAIIARLTQPLPSAQVKG